MNEILKPKPFRLNLSAFFILGFIMFAIPIMMFIIFGVSISDVAFKAGSSIFFIFGVLDTLYFKWAMV